MMKVMQMALMLSLLGFGFACGAGEEPAEEPVVEEPVVEEPVVEEPVAEAEPSAEELPIAEDFEEEVAEAITAENYDDVLAEIEAELAE